MARQTMNRHYLLLCIILYLFWLILSGLFTPLLLGFGAVSVGLVGWLAWRMDRVDGMPVLVLPTLALLGYGLWLLWSVFKANIDVARRIWSPDLPIGPNWGRLDVGLVSPLAKTLYANSITLTPGTLVLDVQEDHFLVHSLCAGGIEELRDGEMQRRIRRLGL